MEKRAKSEVRQHEEGRISELVNALRDRERKAFPYIAGIASTVAIATVSFIAINRLNSKEDIYASALMLSTTMGTNVFRDAQRNLSRKNYTEYLQTSLVGKAEQGRIAVQGTFDEKSALLDNPHVNWGVKSIICEDRQFRAQLTRRIHTAIKDLENYEAQLNRTRDSYYFGVVEAIRKSMHQYQRNLLTIDGYKPEDSNKMGKLGITKDGGRVPFPDNLDIAV